MDGGVPAGASDLSPDGRSADNNVETLTERTGESDRCNGFERESPAMEVELLERVYLPLHEGRLNRKPGGVEFSLD
jgi:hypothetical protein